MRKEEADIPVWCFLTAQFLDRFESNKSKEHYLQVYNDFLNGLEVKPKMEDFNCKNQGLILMLCYGLLVYPVEYWKSFLKDNNRIEELNKSFIEAAEGMGDLRIKSFEDLFTIAISANSREDFLRKLRNAVSHAHIEVDISKNLYTFWNYQNFRVSISHANMGIFLTGLGRHFSNAQRLLPPS